MYDYFIQRAVTEKEWFVEIVLRKKEEIPGWVIEQCLEHSKYAKLCTKIVLINGTKYVTFVINNTSYKYESVRSYWSILGEFFFSYFTMYENLLQLSNNITKTQLYMKPKIAIGIHQENI